MINAGIIANARRRVTAFDPATLSVPLHLRVDAQTQTAANNTSLTQLTDQSGNARHATKTAGTLTYLTAGIGTHGGFQFAAGTYCTTPTFTAISSATPITVFAVAKFGTTASQDLLSGASPGFSLEIGALSSAWLVNRAATATGGTLNQAQHRFNWFLAGSGASTSYLTIDGTTAVGPAAAGSGAPTSWRVGASSSGFANFNGTIGEVLVYAGVLTSTEITNMQTYLSAKWA